MENCLILRVAKVFSNSFSLTSRPVMSSSDEIPSILVLQLLKKNRVGAENIDDTTSWKMHVVIPGIGP